MTDPAEITLPPDYEGDIPPELLARAVLSVQLYLGMVGGDPLTSDVLEVVAPHFIGYGFELGRIAGIEEAKRRLFITETENS